MSPRARRPHTPRRPPRGPNNPVRVYAENDPRIPAALELLERTGAAEVQMRYDNDEVPTVWLAVARWEREGGNVWECGGAMTPARAMFRLLDEVVDGGECQHCKRPTGFSPDLDPLPLDVLICWYQWDPELKTFRRGCAGNEPAP